MVQFSKIGALAALIVPSVYGAPLTKRQAALTDVDILQFALTLEHLENVFYKQGVSQMPLQAFLDAGYSWEFYNNLKYITHDEEAHVQLLESALTDAGASPVAACEYSFPFTDPQSFVTLSSVLEGVGTAAYLGAAPAIQEPAYLSVAGSILVTEAIHTGIQRLALGQVAPADPYGSSLIPNAVFTLAAAFIVSCPDTNAPLPFMAFPTLTATQGIPAAPGITFTFTTEAPLPSTFFVTFVNGLQTVSVPGSFDGSMITATIPPAIGGQTYAIITSTETTALMDSEVIAGPAIIEVTPDSPTFDTSIL